MAEEADRINVMDLGDVPPSSQEGTLQRRLNSVLGADQSTPSAMPPPPSIKISRVLDIDQFITHLTAPLTPLAVEPSSVEDCTTPVLVSTNASLHKSSRLASKAKRTPGRNTTLVGLLMV